jgi:hypothetical protein
MARKQGRKMKIRALVIIGFVIAGAVLIYVLRRNAMGPTDFNAQLEQSEILDNLTPTTRQTQTFMYATDNFRGTAGFFQSSCPWYNDPVAFEEDDIIKVWYELIEGKDSGMLKFATGHSGSGTATFSMTLPSGSNYVQMKMASAGMIWCAWVEGGVKINRVVIHRAA